MSEESLRAIKVGEKIGEGAYAKVFKGFVPDTGHFVTIKVFELQGEHSSEQMANIVNEVSLLKRLKHPNVVRYLGVGTEQQALSCSLTASFLQNSPQQKVLLYMEHLQGGSIQQQLRQYGPFHESLIKKFMVQVLSGLRYLHNEGVVHSDIKAGNVLSDGEGNIKLSDFGCSKQSLHRATAKEDGDMSGSAIHEDVRGSIYWMSPEMLLDKAYGRKHDVWSLGCLVIEMATACHPWPNTPSLKDLLALLKARKTPPLPNHLSRECQHFIRCCCTHNTTQRPTVSQLLGHAFLKEAANITQL